MSTTPVTPRPAATLILVRDAAHGMEVLMARRTQMAEFAAGVYVFPGGAVDQADNTPDIAALAHGLDDDAASKRLGIARGGLAYWIAAIRECFEEAGLLFAYRSDGELIDIDGRHADTFAAARGRLAQGELPLIDLLRTHQLRLATDRLHYFSHWITQAGRPRRYDTRFLLAEAPARQTSSHDGEELVHHVWISPAEALERNRDGQFNLMFPTMKTIEALAKLRDVEEAIAFARSTRPMPPMEPRAATGKQGRKFLVPGDYAYAEVGKLDPEHKGTAAYEITPGEAVRLSARVRRVTAANPSMMTGPGTNTYLVGDATSGIAVIDPGPAIDEHVQAIVRAADGPIRWILCTHTHQDHSPAAQALKALTGATTYGMVAKYPANQDTTFAPDQMAREGERLAIAGCSIRVLHTPGHASNQICYLLEDEKLLFTGDHIMQGSTVVINPPDGNMREYFASLERLYQEALDWIAPGHGFLMQRPHEVVERLIVHRRGRENKVVNALRAAPNSTIEELVPTVYDDTPPRLHAMAARSLFAHLEKLEAEARARRTQERWTLVG